MSLRIKPLQAFHGDSILISFEHNRTIKNILIDGGTGSTYKKKPKALKTELEGIKQRNENIDLLVITHIDDDHIGGIVRMFEYEDKNLDLIKKVWFNSGELISAFFRTDIDPQRECPVILNKDPELSVKQGITLEKLLKKLGYWEQKAIYTGCDALQFYNSKITILSPDKTGLEKLNKKWETEKDDVRLSRGPCDYKIPISQLKDKPFVEDHSVPNESSISFLFEYRGKKILFLADSHPSVAADSIKKLGYSPGKKLEVDLVKIAHHSSRKNTCPGLLELIKCSDYLICTNGKRHGLPDKEPMARIIAANNDMTRLHFNYDNIAQKIFLPQDYRDFNFQCKYLNNGYIGLT